MKINKKYIFVLAFTLLVSFAAYSYARPVQPDLTVTDITFYKQIKCAPNSTTNVSVTVNMIVWNIGNSTALNFTDTLKIEGTTYYFSVASLAAGDTLTHSKTVSRQCNIQFTANATADTFNSVIESNESNNNRVETYTP